MDVCDQRQENGSKKAVLRSRDNREPWWWYSRLLLFSLKLVKMIQAIKDLANSLVPSGKLILLVDTLLVPVFLFCLFGFLFCFVFLFLIHDDQILALTKNILRVFYCYIWQPLMVDTLPHPFNDEIKGIAHVADVPLGKSVFHWFVCFPLFSLSSFQSPANITFSSCFCRGSCLVQHLLWGVHCVHIDRCRRQ